MGCVLALAGKIVAVGHAEQLEGNACDQSSFFQQNSLPDNWCTFSDCSCYTAAGYGIFIAVMFNMIWISQLIPLLRANDRVEYAFSVFIIDLVFIMPTFVLTALWLLRGRALGIVGIPALFVLGIGILSPLALGELLAPVRFGRPMNLGEFWLYSTLSLSFVIFAAVYLTALKLPKRSGEERISSK